MGFLDTLKGVTSSAVNPKVVIPPNLPAALATSELSPFADGSKASLFDAEQWRKKLKRILEELPTSQAQWSDLAMEAGALGFDPEWVSRCFRDEFALMTRKIVSDRVVTSAEHHKLDLARDLMAISDSDAEAILHSIVAEAEAFFGTKVEGA